MSIHTFGKLPAGPRLERIKTSKAYNGNAFENFSPTSTMAPDASYAKVIRNSLRKDDKRMPPSMLPFVKSDLHHPPSPKPVITWFGHSSYLLQVAGKNILVDPVFSNRPSFSQCIGPAAYPGSDQYDTKELPHIDVLIITHDHYDHLDYQTIIDIKDRVKHVYTSLGVGSHLEHWGIAPAKITELDWWERTDIPDGMSLTAAPARHFSGRGLIRNKTLWSSFILNTGQYNMYLGGDSGYDTHFKQIGGKFGPFDLAILENGQYDRNWPFIHMMPEQTAQAALDLDAKWLFPVHWSKYTLSVHAWNDPAIRLRKKAKELNLNTTTPRIGEQIILGEHYPTDEWWNF